MSTSSCQHLYQHRHVSDLSLVLNTRKTFMLVASLLATGLLVLRLALLVAVVRCIAGRTALGRTHGTAMRARVGIDTPCWLFVVFLKVIGHWVART